MDLEGQEIGPIHELGTADSGQEATARFHIEQPGRMRGTIRHAGEEIAIDCYSMRDTSFGPREYESLASGGYFWGIAPDRSFHPVPMGEGGEQRVIGGSLRTRGPRSRASA